MGHSGEATWIANGDRPLAAYVLRPDSPSVRGSLVIAPAIGKEGIVSFRALRALALQAAAAGFVVVQFSWSGEGESSPLPDGVTPPAAWAQDLESAVALAAKLVPGVRPQVLGLRLGAAVVANLAPETAADRILWDPVRGRAWLRYHQALRQMSVPLPLLPDGVEVDGTWYTDEQAAGIKAMKYQIAADDPAVTVREEEPEIATKLYLSINYAAEIPHSSIDSIVAALPRTDADQATWQPTLRALIPMPGGAVEEEFVEIGPHRLPGVLTRSPELDPERVVAFTGSGAEPRTGPAHAWVPMGRRLAQHGVVSIRADRRGLGDLMNPEEVREPNPYTEAAVADCVETIRFLVRRYPLPVTALGVCVGSWLFARASASVKIDRIEAFNAIAWKPGVRYYAMMRRTQDMLPVAATPDTGDDAAAPAGFKAKLRTWLKQQRNDWLPRVPPALWQAVARTGVLQYPAETFRRASRETQYRYHMGPQDAEHFHRVKGPHAFEQVRKAGFDVTATEWDDLDHSLLAEASRRRTEQVLTGSLGLVGGATASAA